MDIVDISGTRLTDSVAALENNSELKPVEGVRSKLISRRNSTYEDADQWGVGYWVTISARGRRMYEESQRPLMKEPLSLRNFD